MLIIVKTYNTQTHPLGTVHFFMREGGGAGGIWGGHSKKIGLKGGASRKKMKEEGASDEKIRLKIG